MQKRTLKIFTILFLIISVIGFSSALTCNIVSQNLCDASSGHVVMKLSSLNNAHVEISGTYPDVLCCDGGIGNTTCSGANKIIGLSATGNAHAELPTQSNYPASDNVCYEDLECLSLDTTGSNCSTSTTGTYPIDMLSLSSPTNAHVGPITADPSISICCKSASLIVTHCSLSSASWEKTDVLDGENNGMNVDGANCAGATITFDIYAKQTTGGDDLITTKTATYPSGSWDAVWRQEAITEILTNNKYYFVASAGTSQVTSGLMGVSQETIEHWCQTHGSPAPLDSCGKYSTEALCSENRCGLHTGCPTLQPGDTCTCAWSSDNTCNPTIIPGGTTSYCGDSNVDRPNSAGVNEQCDPDVGTNVFLSTENTCQKVNNAFTGGILGCQTDCTFNTTSCTNPNPPVCGDNIVNKIGEFCDGTDLSGKTCQSYGYDGGTLGCYPAGNANQCDFDLSGCYNNQAQCGNNIVETGEVCDGTQMGGLKDTNCADYNAHFTSGTITCSSDCSSYDWSACHPISCGNGVLDNGEQCDDGNTVSGDGCSATCTDEVPGAVCNNNIIETGEVCDGTELNGLNPDCTKYNHFTSGTLTCRSDCSGYNWDSCNPNTCGNGVLDGTEQCDDGNTVSGDGCSATCQNENTQVSHFCGDGVIDTPNDGNMNEQCDGPLTSTSCVGTDSYTGGTKSCSEGCLIDISKCTGGTPVCNDGVVNQLTEECDKTDLQGLTCGSLGFAVTDGLKCDNNCKLDTSACVPISGGRTGGVEIIHTINTDTNGCEDGILTYDWWCEWTGTDATRPSADECPTQDNPKTEAAPCVAQAQLPFFGIYQFIISFALILGIYFLVVKIKKKR